MDNSQKSYHIAPGEYDRRMKIHGHRYHYDNTVQDQCGETFRVFGKIIGDWSIDLHVANQRATREVWIDREESPDIVYVANLDDDTPDLNRIVDVFEFDRLLNARVDVQKPGACVTRHVDDFTTMTRSGEKIVRIMIMLEEWQPGQILMFGNNVFSSWQKGQVLYSDFEKIPHATSNASWVSRSILVLTGAVSENTLRMLAFGIDDVHI